MRITGLEKAQDGIKIAGRNISHLRYAGDTTLMAENEELKSLLKKVKEESEKVGLKLNIHGIWSHHFMQIDGETVADFIFWAPKSLQVVTTEDAYSLEGKL